MRAERGETLTETLVAVLVISLALVLLANMVTASQRLIMRGTERFHTNTAVKNQVESGASPSASAEGKVSFSNTEFSDGTRDTFNWKGKIEDTTVNLETYDGDVTVTYTSK